MRRVPTWRSCALVCLAGWAAISAGCTHNYYYGNAWPACAEPVAVAPAGSVAVCEVPTQVVGGTVVAAGPGRTTVVSDAPRPRRVVVSEPSGGDNDGILARAGSRISGWRRTDPETRAITRIDGALGDDDAIRE